MILRRSGLAAAALVAGLLAAAVAGAAGPGDDGCLMCHKDRTLARDIGRNGSLTVDAAAQRASAHAGMACVDCHRDAKTLRHPPQLERVRCVRCHAAARDTLAASVHARVGGGGVDESCSTCHGGPHNVARLAGRARCAGCHAAVSQEYEHSVHGVARAHGDTDASSCQDCHGKAHQVRSHRDPASPVSRDRIDETCARCHADRQIVTRRKITIPDAVQLFRDSAHGRSNKDGAARCNDCHESHRLRRMNDPASSIYRSNIPTTCAKCHPRQAEAYLASVHGSAMRRGVNAAPVCTDCHGEHLIRGPHDPDSPVAAAHVTETCSRCHEAAGIRETFGLPAGRLSSYRDSFHGLAARGGSPVVANCASCHGYHDILPSSDPRSSVSPDRLGTTCGRCHPGGNGKLLSGPVHVAMVTPSQPPLYWTRMAYLLLIVGTIGFMALHNGLDFVRKTGRQFAEHMGRVPSHAHAAEHWTERMTVLERLQHGLLAASFLTLVLTGFALKFPEAIPFAWIARLEGGYAWRANIHRVAAVIMVVTSLAHVAYLFSPRGRRLVADLLPGVQDARDLAQNLLYLLGLRREPARFDRFGYIEKAEYWALIWGTIVMTLTGVMLWFENTTLRAYPKWVLDLATLIHYYEAWLAFLAIVVWHLYTNILNPDVYPMNWTWLTGRISDAQLRHEHAIEWERRSAAAAAQAAADARAAAAAAEAEAAGGSGPPSGAAPPAADPQRGANPPGSSPSA